MVMNLCEHGSECLCQSFSVPISCSFTRGCDCPTVETLPDVHQSKGEAEMSQVDWILQDSSQLETGKAACSVVTSGDIDAVPIHLYALSGKWRKEGENFKNPVYVILKKPGKRMDIYNVTGILQELEKKFSQDEDIGKKIAIILCMEGNDFLPKFHNKSHFNVLQLFLNEEQFQSTLFTKDLNSEITVNSAVYKEFIKRLYLPLQMEPTSTYSEVRNCTMYSKRKKTNQDTVLSIPNLRDDQMWLPPETALDRMTGLINLQISYLDTVGKPAAPLPDFFPF